MNPLLVFYLMMLKSSKKSIAVFFVCVCLFAADARAPGGTERMTDAILTDATASVVCTASTCGRTSQAQTQQRILLHRQLKLLKEVEMGDSEFSATSLC